MNINDLMNFCEGYSVHIIYSCVKGWLHRRNTSKEFCPFLGIRNSCQICEKVFPEINKNKGLCPCSVYDTEAIINKAIEIVFCYETKYYVSEFDSVNNEENIKISDCQNCNECHKFVICSSGNTQLTKKYNWSDKFLDEDIRDNDSIHNLKEKAGEKRWGTYRKTKSKRKG